MDSDSISGFDAGFELDKMLSNLFPDPYSSDEADLGIFEG